MRKELTTTNGVTVSYSTYGSGPPLVLVHGSFSDDVTNWEFIKPILETHFTVYAIARRGRGNTDATSGHSLEDEARDVLALVQAVGEPVFLLGHSYGAHCALIMATLAPDLVRKLVVYEPIWPFLISDAALQPLVRLAELGNWDEFAFSFFRDVLKAPVDELEQLCASQLWPPILDDAQASLEDLRAVNSYVFDTERFQRVNCPVLLQIGSESPRDLYITDALVPFLADSRIESLEGQAHEGMTTAPEMYAESVCRFLIGDETVFRIARSDSRLFRERDFATVQTDASGDFGS
jgi:pimeloyl-ACP methyl ester carboxylesterase